MADPTLRRNALIEHPCERPHSDAVSVVALSDEETGAKLKRFHIVLAAAALSGCASTKEVLDGPVTQTFHVAKSADEVSFCLANRNNTVPLPRDDGSRVVLIKNGYGAVSLAFTIFSEGEGSRVEYRKKFGTFGGAWKRCVGLEPDKD